MFRRKLAALSYHTSDNFNINAANEFRTLVVWLEDQKIRHYKMECRENVRDITSPNWPATFEKYLQDLLCPYNPSDPHAVLDWLLGYAVRAEYGDNVEKYKAQSAENIIKVQTNVPEVVTSNPLDNLDFSGPEFKAGIDRLAQLLKINQHPNHLVTLAAVATFVKLRLSPDAIKNPDEIIAEGSPFPLQEYDMGFESIKDNVMRQAAKILRLLYIHDLRDLQTKINEAIVAVQTITADPKTDTRLGKVGK